MSNQQDSLDQEAINTNSIEDLKLEEIVSVEQVKSYCKQDDTFFLIKIYEQSTNETLITSKEFNLDTYSQNILSLGSGAENDIVITTTKPLPSKICQVKFSNGNLTIIPSLDNELNFARPGGPTLLDSTIILNNERVYLSKSVFLEYETNFNQSLKCKECLGFKWFYFISQEDEEKVFYEYFDKSFNSNWIVICFCSTKAIINSYIDISKNDIKEKINKFNNLNAELLNSHDNSDSKFTSISLNFNTEKMIEAISNDIIQDDSSFSLVKSLFFINSKPKLNDIKEKIANEKEFKISQLNMIISNAYFEGNGYIKKLMTTFSDFFKGNFPFVQIDDETLKEPKSTLRKEDKLTDEEDKFQIDDSLLNPSKPSHYANRFNNKYTSNCIRQDDSLFISSKKMNENALDDSIAVNNFDYKYQFKMNKKLCDSSFINTSFNQKKKYYNDISIMEQPSSKQNADESIYVNKQERIFDNLFSIKDNNKKIDLYSYLDTNKTSNATSKPTTFGSKSNLFTINESNNDIFDDQKSIFSKKHYNNNNSSCNFIDVFGIVKSIGNSKDLSLYLKNQFNVVSVSVYDSRNNENEYYIKLYCENASQLFSSLPEDIELNFSEGIVIKLYKGRNLSKPNLRASNRRV